MKMFKEDKNKGAFKNSDFLICQKCGTQFYGGRSAKYCVECKDL